MQFSNFMMFKIIGFNHITGINQLSQLVDQIFLLGPTKNIQADVGVMIYEQAGLSIWTTIREWVKKCKPT